MKIYKYKLLPNALHLSVNGKILSVANQYDDLVVYVEIDDTLPTKDYLFYVFPTGDTFELSKDAIFLGTVMFAGGRFVQHVYYKEVVF